VDNIADTIPLGRTGRPEEIAWLLAYLASPAGDYYSGTTITLDGGRDDWFGSWPPERLQARGGELPAEERR
jgi:citronellol/citronellal dehydrogenase